METKTKPLAAPPKRCQCGSEATVVVLEVIHWASGQTRQGAASEFCELVGKKRELMLRRPFGFSRWIAQCAWCFCGNTNQEEMFG